MVPWQPAPRIDDEQARAFEDAVERGSEVESDLDLSEEARRTSQRVPGVGLLTALLRATLFTQLLQHQADSRFLHETPQERLQAMIDLHPRFYKWCRNADFVARSWLLLVISVVVGGAGAGVAWKLFFK